MPKPELSKFLCVEVLQKVILAAPPILYLTAKAGSCVLDNLGVEEVGQCDITTLCTTYLGVILVLYFLYGIAQASLSEAQKSSAEYQQHTIRIFQVAKLDITPWKSLLISLWVVTALISIYLFSHIESSKLSNLPQLEGLATFAALSMLFLSFAESLTAMQIQGDWGTILVFGENGRTRKPDQMARHCGAASTHNDFDRALRVLRNHTNHNRIFFSVASVLFLLTVMMRPKDASKGYNLFLHAHFFCFGILSDGFVAIRHARRGKWNMVAVEMFIIVCLYFPAWWVLLKFRKRLAALPLEELSNYLIDNVIKAGLGALIPMLFLTFDTMSCIWDADIEVAAEECAALSSIQQYLSYYLFTALMLKLCSQTVPLNVRSQVETQMYQIASFRKMVLRQRVQLGLTFITGLCAIYLISHSGSSYAAQKNEDILAWLGAGGALTATIALTMELRQLVIVHRKIIKFEKSESLLGGGVSTKRGEGGKRVSLSAFGASPFSDVL
ncbi:hypothetical protein TrLO_g1780 [Triparma laevis f. longispina]|uniref:Uncharacterized protein n=1 Tax=Triparma laevis f. longispina TaxID=1714387 RepID=A0A9W7FT75_9STRA|nr:hypothetical protein TrLO_g1780 [Triparma laevis f. longispina]